MKCSACIIAFLLCSCGKDVKVGEVYENVATKERVTVEMIGSLEEVKAYADSFYARAMQGELSVYAAKDSLTPVQKMRVSLIRSVYAIRTGRVEARYKQLVPYAGEKFFLRHTGGHDEEIVFLPLSDLKEYRRVDEGGE